MADYSDPKRAVAYRFTVSLFARSDNQIKTAPTLAAGDVKVSKDNGATANITTLPAEAPASSGILQVDLSATEMTADLVTVIFRDAAGAEWNDVAINLATGARQMADLAYPATTGRSMVVDAAGLVDANAVKVGPTGTGTAQTAKDVGGAVPAAAAGASGGLLISGSNSGTTTLAALTVTGATTLTGNVALADGLTIAAPSTLNRAGITVTGNGTGDGIISTGGASAGGDGIAAVAGGGVPIRGDITGNITGTITTVTGAVGSVTGAVGSVTGAVASVTGNVGGNVVGSVASVTAGVTLAASAVQAIWDALTTALTTVGSIGKLIVDNINATISSRMPTTHLAATAGKLDGVALADTVTTYTGNTKQTADVATLITTVGVAGAGLTAADDATIAAIAAEAVKTAAIKAKTDNLPAAPAAVGDIPTANANADALLDRAAGIETGLTVRQGFRLWASVLLGKLSGGGTATEVFRDTGDLKDRVTATVDSSGNRTAITRDAT